ncbi:Acetate CoA-transferase subunit alpha [invertebrate metagenome]|uniref:Acetate CoA-transferase subunit alpha n=1 Tax=invertebrate metagenome TaxID=1711999 RepID=A0A2H9T8T9_9ZZZZ
MQRKPVISAQQAADKVKPDSRVMIGGFMAVGTPEKIINALVDFNTKALTIIANDSGFIDKGIGLLVVNHQVKKMIATHIGLNSETGRQMNLGELEAVLVPQGTLIEQIRCAGAGLGGVLTQTGLGTSVAEGKKTVECRGETYLLEEPIEADIALLKASVVDKAGNCIFNKTTKNFNPVMATAAKTVIVEADQLVEVGEIEADHFMLPGTFIDYIVH